MLEIETMLIFNYNTQSIKIIKKNYMKIKYLHDSTKTKPSTFELLHVCMSNVNMYRIGRNVIL